MPRDPWWFSPAVAAWRMWAATIRLRPSRPRPRAGPVVYACLHRDILPAILFVRPVRPVLLVSRSRDGDLLVRCLGRDYGFVRGSTGKAGGAALRGLLAALAAGRPVGIAVDGPRGPYGTVHEGVVSLARLSGCPVVPLRARPGPHRALANWDRTVVPWPGSRVRMEEGPELRLSREDATGEGAAVLAAWLLGKGGRS